jgi:hypothetical protein
MIGSNSPAKKYRNIWIKLLKPRTCGAFLSTIFFTNCCACLLFCITIFPHHLMRGRNNTLLNRRNQQLIIRYYYWYELQRKRMDDVITILSEEEFYLQPYTVREILRSNTELIKELKRQRPDEKKLPYYQFSTLSTTPVQTAMQF